MIIRLILFLTIGYIALKVFKKLLGPGPQNPMRAGNRQTGGADDLMVKDPQCDTYISKRDAVQAYRDGQTHYFCSEECRDAYLSKT